MTICYFGDYDRDYARTRVILLGLAMHGVKIVHVNIRDGGKLRLYRLYRALRDVKEHYDHVFIPMSNARMLSLVAKLATRKPVIWEPLFSLYDNWVYDRKLARPYSLKALYYWTLDWLGCYFSDLVILDTNTNAEYFAKTFRFSREKFARVLVGSDDSTFFPKERTSTSGSFEVEFHGGYIPVQGTDVIIRAAKILENDHVHFTMIGSGQMLSATKKIAEELAVKNVTFHPFLPQHDVAEFVRNADVCIGLIGDVPRIVRAIPNKLYEAAAMARVSINADTSALREVFVPDEDVVCIEQGNPTDLALAIKKLRDSGRGGEMGKMAYETFRKKCGPKIIAESLLLLLKMRAR